MSNELDLEHLRKVAEAATPGPWEPADEDGWIGADGCYVVSSDENSINRADRPIGLAYNRPSDAEHIAAFDPPTVLALFDRLEASEAEASKYRGLYDEAESAHTDAERKATDLFNEGIRQKKRAIAAEAKLARVREVYRAKETQQMRYRNTENGNSSRYWVNVQMCSGCSADYPCPTIRALDGSE